MPENWKFLTEAHKFTDLPQDEIPEIVFWGRSNVGKSSLVNSITNLKIAKTSKTPGRTRSLVFFELKGKFRIVDFPGYGWEKNAGYPTAEHKEAIKLLGTTNLHRLSFKLH